MRIHPILPKKAGFGCVVEIIWGGVIISCAGPLQQAIFAEHEEILGIWRCFLWAQQLQIEPIIISTDCLAVVNKLANTTLDLSPLGDFLELLSSKEEKMEGSYHFLKFIKILHPLHGSED